MLKMNESQLLDVVINEIVDVYELNSSCKNILKRNILNRCALYKNVSISKTNETQIIRNNTSLLTFFLNRLLNNIREYNFEKELNLDGHKGSYISYYQRLNMHSFESIKRMTESKLKNRLSIVAQDVLNRATIKVLDHEIGHALQTSFVGGIGYNDRKFKILVDSLNKKYSDIFYSYDALGKEQLKVETRGMDVTRKKDKYEKARNYYAPNAFTSYIDEIFNESEAIKVKGINTPQMSYKVQTGYERDVYNYESSNYRITPYAEMMKILMGSKRTFVSMYEDSIIMYSYFDDFLKESLEAFGKQNGAPMYHVLNHLNIINTSKNRDDILNSCLTLDLFFTRCLENKIDNAINNQKLDANQIDVLTNKLDLFEKNLVRSSSKLQSFSIISALRQRLKNLKNSSVSDLLDELDGKNDKNTYNNFVAILDRMYDARMFDKSDEFKKYYEELKDCEKKINKVNLSCFSKKYEELSIDEKFQFLLYNMKKAILSNELNEYQIIREKYVKLTNGIEEKPTLS